MPQVGATTGGTVIATVAGNVGQALSTIKSKAKTTYSKIGHHKEYTVPASVVNQVNSLYADASASSQVGNSNYVKKPRATVTGANTNNVPSYVPPQYVSWVQSAAKATGLPASVVAAQINDESSFNPSAASGAGAQGIAQFEASTFKKYGPAGGNPNNPADAKVAYTNYMNALLRQYKGNVRNALAAYNAGPNNISAGYGYADNILSASGVASGVAAGATAATPKYGGTRPGGEPVNPDGTPANQGQAAQGLFADYESELTLPRVAPSSAYTSGFSGPFRWYLASLTGKWQEEQGDTGG